MHRTATTTCCHPTMYWNDCYLTDPECLAHVFPARAVGLSIISFLHVFTAVTHLSHSFHIVSSIYLPCHVQLHCRCFLSHSFVWSKLYSKHPASNRQRCRLKSPFQYIKSASMVFRFLDLPPELRVEVYSHLIYVERRIPISRVAPERPVPLYYKTVASLFLLRLTCQQINEEVQGELQRARRSLPPPTFVLRLDEVSPSSDPELSTLTDLQIIMPSLRDVIARDQQSMAVLIDPVNAPVAIDRQFLTPISFARAFRVPDQRTFERSLQEIIYQSRQVNNMIELLLHATASPHKDFCFVQGLIMGGISKNVTFTIQVPDGPNVAIWRTAIDTRSPRLYLPLNWPGSGYNYRFELEVVGSAARTTEGPWQYCNIL